MPRPSQPGSNEWLYDTIQEVRRELLGAHERHSQEFERLRGEMNAVSRRMNEHDAEDQLVENRVLRIEIQREEERHHREAQIRRVTVDNSRIAAVISGCVAIVAQIAKSTWDFYHH